MPEIRYKIGRPSPLGAGLETVCFEVQTEMEVHHPGVERFLSDRVSLYHAGWTLIGWRAVQAEEVFDAFIETDKHFNQEGQEVGLPEGERIFVNSIYQVNMKVEQITEWATIQHLSIKRRDKQPVRDWRHFQWIKNDLCGEETTGMEVYPPESKLVDTANQYHLWVFPDPDTLGFIWQTRIVAEANSDGAVQRPWPADRRPADLIDADTLKQMCDDYRREVGLLPIEQS